MTNLENAKSSWIILCCTHRNSYSFRKALASACPPEGGPAETGAFRPQVWHGASTVQLKCQTAICPSAGPPSGGRAAAIIIIVVVVCCCLLQFFCLFYSPHNCNSSLNQNTHHTFLLTFWIEKYFQETEIILAINQFQIIQHLNLWKKVFCFFEKKKKSPYL